MKNVYTRKEIFGKVEECIGEIRGMSPTGSVTRAEYRKGMMDAYLHVRDMMAIKTGEPKKK